MEIWFMLSYLLSIYQSPTVSAATVQWEIIRAFEPPKLPMGGYTFMSVLPSAKCILFVRNISLSQSHKPFFFLVVTSCFYLFFLLLWLWWWVDSKKTKWLIFIFVGYYNKNITSDVSSYIFYTWWHIFYFHIKLYGSFTF